MSDLSINAALVVGGSSGTFNSIGTAGSNLTAGQPVYSDPNANSTIKPCNVASNAVLANAIGITLHGALTGQPIAYQKSGNLTVGNILNTGTWYFASNTAGGIAPQGDLASTWYSTVVGYALSTSVLFVLPVPSGVVKA